MIKKYNEFVNEIFKSKPSLNWQFLPNESSINIIYGNNVWKIKDPLFKNFKNADDIFMKVRKHIKNLTNKSPESITNLLNKSFIHSKVTQVDISQPI